MSIPQVNFNIPLSNSENSIYTKYEVNMEEYQIKIESLISLLSELFTTENFEVDFQLAYSKTELFLFAIFALFLL